MTDKIKISSAKGRPFLRWVGKKPLDYVKSFPAQLVEIFDPTDKADRIATPTFEKFKDGWQNLLFHGDNKEVLGFLLASGFRGEVDFIYIDPPFDSKANYVRKVQLRGIRERKIEGEGYTVGEQLQYTDIWANDNYLQFMYERLLLLAELLSKDGFIILHCDYHKGHYLKVIMDEVFGPENFRNEIVVKRVQKNFAEGEYIKSMNNAYDTLLLYAKNPVSKFLPPRNHESKTENGEEGEENWHGFDAPNWSGGRPNLYYELFGQYPPPGNVWRWEPERANAAIKDGTLRQSPKTGKPEYLVLNDKGAMVNNLWADLLAYSYREDYPTSKSKKLLSRIIEILTKEDSLVLDCFIGSGTAAAVAQQFNRRWIGCDINKGAIHTTSKRIQRDISESQEENQDNDNGKIKYPTFAVYRVNDYDLQLLQAEAKNIVIEHLGIQKVATDPFFDGVLGKNLVRIIDFSHPLTLLDLQIMVDELKKRPEENRNITIVCLGMDTSINPWIEDYNKKHSVNKLNIIELRTDSKYGKLLVHKPPVAKVNIRRKNDIALIEIKDFISPTIIERLKESNSLLNVSVSDFRSMIDVILIDNNYDGKVFNIMSSDVPASKDELVKGSYEIKIPKKQVNVAVKIIDMLGEEILVSKKI